MTTSTLDDVETSSPGGDPPNAPPRRPAFGATTSLSWVTMRTLCFAALFIVVVVPVGWLLVYSVTDGRTGGFTLNNYVTIFTDSLYYVPFLRSLRLGVTVSILCILLGTSMAYLVARTDMPGRASLRYVVYLSFIVPSLLAGVAWVMLASPNEGLLNRFFDSTLGIKPLNVFTLTAMAIVMALALYPLTFIFVLNSLDMQSGDIDEAGAILGASAARRALTISLPLVLPAILNAALLAFLQAISLYAIPALLAIPAGEQVLTTQLFQLFGFPSDPQLAAAYSVPLVLLAIIVLTVRRKLLGRKGYATVGGRATRTIPVKLRAWRWPAAIYCWAVVFIAVVLPGATLIYISLIPQWANGGTDFTLMHYQWVFENARTPVWNTIQFSVAAAALCVTLGFAVSYLTERRNSKIDRLLEFLTTTPIVLPGMIIAIGMFAAFSKPPLLLYGTGALLVIVFFGRFMPTALQNIQPAIRSIHPDLENASRILGAGPYRTMGKITIPLSSAVLISAWIFTFVLSTHEVSAAILLVSLDTDVMATQVMNLYEQAKYEQIAALGIVLVAITMVAVAVGTIFGGRQVLNRGKEI